MKTISEKQQKFIAVLARQTGAYQDGEGMIVGMKCYRRLDLDAALEGDCSSYEASKIIDVLLKQDRYIETAEERTQPTEKQISYATVLLEKAGREAQELEGLTRKEVSALIDELRTAQMAAAN